MDAFTLDGLIAELRPVVVGRHIARVRAADAQAVLVEIAGARDLHLWLDAGRLVPGVYRLTRAEARALQDEAALAGASRQALLHLRKHLEGRRLSGLRRVAGERALVLEAGEATLVLRLSATPALTLAAGGRARATVGEGAPAWPPPAEAPEREWDRVGDEILADALVAARKTGAPAARAVLRACPVLGPVLARAVAASAREDWPDLRGALAAPRPVLLAAAPVESSADADLAAPDAVLLAPVDIARLGLAAWPQPSWTAAAAALLRARLRGHRFDRARRAAAAEAARRTRRLAQLLAHLEEDRRGLPAAADLRRHAEALLAAGPETATGVAEVEVDDPYRPGTRLRVRVDPRIGLPANADRLFAKARRMDRAVARVESRVAETRAGLEASRAAEAAVRLARNLRDLAPSDGGRAAEAPAAPAASSATRHYLSSRGLSILVGRGARENHRLTFGVAGPEDLWLHARDVPGAHVILRDPEGRAAPEDQREAAEVAAFFSQAAPQSQVDVHVTRRKHVRAARGGAGRVVVGHSETLRVVPRDPEGRLRRR
jgi:hypothetical protein